MAVEKEALRDWHRLFGLLLMDFFSESPFVVDVERDLSVQQQFLDVVIVRRGRGRFADQLPDGLEGLRRHNLMTFKSHHEALDSWAMKELVHHDVAYRKLVSPSPSDLLPDSQFGLYAVSARFPRNLSGQVRWQRVQEGVYDCTWGTDRVRVIVAGELSRAPHNAPLHLFSASPDLVDFGRTAYQRRSENTSVVLGQLFDKLQGEGFAVSFTMEDFKRQYVKQHFKDLTPAERREAIESLNPDERRQMLQSLPVDELLTLLTPEQVQRLRDQPTESSPVRPRKPRKQK